MTEVGKMSCAINFNDKHNQAISNSNIDATKDLQLTGIKKILKISWPNSRQSKLAT